MPKPSFDGKQPNTPTAHDAEATGRLMNDIDGLQNDIRTDFDQRISDLTVLMQKFKRLLITDIKLLRSANSTLQSDNIPLLTQKVDEPSTPATGMAGGAAANEQTSPAVHAVMQRETARFEAGLYQLNSQLYRFRLELDQELEYREEALHTHFRQDSELARVLEELTLKMQQEKEDRQY